MLTYQFYCNTVKHDSLHPLNRKTKNAPPSSPAILSDEVQERLSAQQKSVYRLNFQLGAQVPNPPPKKPDKESRAS